MANVVERNCIRAKMRGPCAYCGLVTEKIEKEHVIPRSLYPASKATSTVQRITVPACSRCNQSFCEAEPHFRNAMLLSGEPNEAVQELWAAKGLKSLTCQPDSVRRARDLEKHTEIVDVLGLTRRLIFPGRDDKVMLVLRKMVRGLAYFHKLDDFVRDERVSAQIEQYRMPPSWEAKLIEMHCMRDIVSYSYAKLDEDDLHSIWRITIFQRTSFIALIVH